MNLNTALDIFGSAVSLAIKEYRKYYVWVVVLGNAKPEVFESAEFFLFDKDGVERFYNRVPMLEDLVKIEAIRYAAIKGLKMKKTFCDLCRTEIKLNDHTYYVSITKAAPRSSDREYEPTFAMPTKEICPACYIEAERRINSIPFDWSESGVSTV